MLYSENISEQLSIDETAFTNGDLYTIVTSKSGKGRKGTLVAMGKGTKSEDVLEVLYKISSESRASVKEITLDLAGSMNLIAKKAFPYASRVIDRFHVQKLAFEAVQEIRIRHRWKAIDNENEAIQKSREQDTVYHQEVYDNGETPKQLLARSRYLLFKSEGKWTENQEKRSTVLFEKFPDIKLAYDLSQKLSWIYENSKDKIYALSRLAKWHEEVRQAKFKTFNTVSKTIELNYRDILNYFDNKKVLMLPQNLLMLK